MRRLMPSPHVFGLARVHRGAPVLGGVVAVTVVSAVLGGTQVPVPSLEDGGGTVGIPFRRDLPLLSAVFLATLWSGPMAAHEQLGSYAFHRARVQLLAGGVLMAACLSLAAETLAVDAAAGLVFVRSLLTWFGLAQLSTALFGPRLTWVLPLASAFPIVWFTGSFWDWTDAAAPDLGFWALAAGSVALGSASLAWTPWRRYASRHRSPEPG